MGKITYVIGYSPWLIYVYVCYSLTEYVVSPNVPQMVLIVKQPRRVGRHIFTYNKRRLVYFQLSFSTSNTAVVFNKTDSR